MFPEIQYIHRVKVIFNSLVDARQVSMAARLMVLSVLALQPGQPQQLVLTTSISIEQTFSSSTGGPSFEGPLLSAVPRTSIQYLILLECMV